MISPFRYFDWSVIALIKATLQKTQADILERKGLQSIYSFFFILCHVVSSPDFPVFSEAIRALVSGTGFVTLLLMFFYCRQSRTAEQSELIRTYAIFLGVFTAVAIFNIIRFIL